MAINPDSDLAMCFSTDDFAVPGTFSTSGVGVVNGYFTNATEAVEISDTRIEATDASFQCRSSLIGAVRQGHTLTVSGVVYTIKRIQRTGTGVSVVYLKN